MSYPYTPFTPTQTTNSTFPPRYETFREFVPAQVMTSTGEIVPEKISQENENENETSHASNQRIQSLADTIPHAQSPITFSMNENAPGTRVVARRNSAHLFLDLSVPAKVETKWETHKMSPSFEETSSTVPAGCEPILPAPIDVVHSVGEEYLIKSTEGRILADSEHHAHIVPEFSKTEMNSSF